MENWSLEILENLVEIDPEQLSNATDKDYSFYYIDISSVSSGMISFPSSTTTFNEAPSRARKILKDGDILMSSVRPNLKAFSRFRSPDNNSQFIASTGFAVLSQKNETDIDYIYHCLFSSPIENQIMSLVVGSNYPALNTRDIHKLKIYLPKEKSEQTKIAYILSTIDEAIQQTEKLIAKYQSIKTGMMQDLLTNGIDVNGNIRSKETHKFVMKNGIEVPEDWEAVRLSHFIEKLESGVSVNSEDKPAGVGQFGVLKTSALTGCIFLPYQNKTVEEKEIKRLKCPVRKGAIIVSRMNTPELVGENALVENDYSNLFLPDRLWQTVYRNEKELDVYWLSKLLTSKKYRTKISFLATGTSGSMKNITKDDFINLFIPKPPKEEQESISKYLMVINENEKNDHKNLNKLNSIKTGLMQDLLSGEVRVK